MSFDFTQWIVRIPVLLFAITIHEYAHGWVAYRLGDPTAKQMGRLSFNPITHIDPLGAICLFLLNFGWAKPVPIDMRYFKNLRRDTILVSLAGPAANFIVAVIAGMLIRNIYFPSQLYQMTLVYLLIMNLGLGLFNLIPIPPLDGSHILENLLPPAAAMKYDRIKRYGPFILIGVIMLDNFAHTGILNMLLLHPMQYLAYLLSGISF